MDATLEGGKTASGVRITRKVALRYAPVWRAVNLLARDVAKLPAYVYRRLGGEGRERDPEHPAYSLIRYRPNSEMPAFAYSAALTANGLLQGNAYGYIRRRNDDTPGELIPLPSSKTYPIRKDGVLWYVTELSNGEHRKLAARDVEHFRTLTEDGIEGLSVVSYARESLGLGLAAHRYGQAFFGKGARPGVVLEHPGKLSDKAKRNIATTWKSIHQGLEKAHLPAVIEEGMKVNPFTSSNNDSQFLETRQHEIREVAGWFGIPPHKLGDTSRTSYNSLEQENQSYLDEALDPLLCAWESERRSKLLTVPQQTRDTHFIEYNRLALIRANLKDRGLYYKIAVTNGWMSRDEVRARENMNPIPAGQGKKFLIPMNMEVVGDLDDDALTLEAKEALRALLSDSSRRMFRRLAVHAQKAARDATIQAWITTGIVDDHMRTIREVLEPVIATIRALGVHVPDTDTAAATLIHLARSYLTMHTMTEAGAALEGPAPLEYSRMLLPPDPEEAPEASH